jgi:hypothetical protein
MTEEHPETQSTPREIVEQIRRFEFGIGASLEGDGLVVVNNMVRRYQSLLATVSEDLNSKDSHFILELIQNADDNRYRDGIAPSLSFRLSPDKLVVVNNEVGFTSENVKALCSAGESSKKNKAGYIGEKGIGFKSVFKVTDTPEIHSNGYHFRFNRTDPKDLLGYVVPHWQQPTFQLDEQATTVVLPTKPGKPFTPDRLTVLDATLLLFLGKVRQLEVQSSNGRFRYLRADSGALTTLTTFKNADDGSEVGSRTQYLRITKTIGMSDLTEPKREKIASTALVIAFPLAENGEASPVEGCPTYAFLPIREFGFNFCIQGDFIVTSSREGIHEDLDWNIRIRDAIAPAFVEALEHLKSTPELARSYLRFLPTEGKVQDKFFKPVVQQILDSLKESECIPVESGRWHKPSQVLMTNKGFRELFSSEDILALFGADYHSSQLVGAEAALERLACRKLLTSDVLGIFKLHSDWLSKRSDDWKARFYAYLVTSPRRQDYVKAMLSLPCVPTSDGRLVTSEHTPVFYPLSADRQYGFEHELTILDAQIYEKTLALTVEATSFFDQLNVKRDNPYELVRSHILGRHTAEALPKAEQDALIGHVRYVRDKFDQYLVIATPKIGEAAAIQALREGLYLGTKQNNDGRWLFSRPGELYIGKEFSPSFCIETLLGTAVSPGLLLSEKYLPKRRVDASKEELDQELALWRSFLARIGVRKSPQVVKLPGGNVKCSDELAALIQSERQTVRRATLECIDKNWAEYAQHAVYPVKTGRYSTTDYPTQFATSLRSTSTPTKRRTSVALEQSYLDTAEIRNILDGNITYVDALLHDHGFLKTCGITWNVDATACLKRLRQIREDGGSTRDQLRAIYRKLEGLWSADGENIVRAFRTEELIAIRSGDKVVWVKPEDTCWLSSKNKFLDALHPPLQPQYVDHSTFFTKLLAVPEKLPIDKWVTALQYLPSVESQQDRANIALAIYRHVSSQLGNHTQGDSQASEPPWLPKFRHSPLFLDHRGLLVPSSATLFFNDSQELAVLFQDVPSISLLAVPHEQLSHLSNLLSAVGVKTISTSLKVAVRPGVQGQLHEPLTRKIREMFMCIARVVYGQSHQRFEIAVNEKLFAELRELEVVVAPDLALEVSLGNVMRQTTGDVARKGNQLLLRADAPSHVDHVAIQIQKLLRLPPALFDTISRVLVSPSVKDAEDFLRVKNVSKLPAEEEQALLLGFPSEAEEQSSVDEDKATPETPSAQTPDIPKNTDSNSPGDGKGKPQGQKNPVTPGSVGEQPGLESPIVSEGSQPPDFKNEPGNAQPASVGNPPEPGPQTTTYSSDGVPRSGEQSRNVLDPSTGNQSPTTDEAAPMDNGATAQDRFPSGAGFSGGHPQRGNASRRSGKAGNKRTRSGRLLSYADVKDQSKQAPDAVSAEKDKKHNTIVEIAAVKHFFEMEASRWKSLQEMDHDNPGFDVKAVAFDGADEVIEVKGQGGAWTEEGVALTPTELVEAHRMRGHYWLCVVEFATDVNRRQHYLIRDPFGLTQQFRFDNGWKSMAITVPVRPERPEPGFFIQVPGEGKGRIVKVKGSGQFTKLQIQFEGGRQLFSKLFNPATMTLSTN